MSKRIEGNQTENSGRNVQGSLDFSEINAYFEQEEDAPSAQEVFDHYWSVLEYVLSDDEKREILTAAPEEGIKKLLALGGGVWNVFEGIDLLKPYGYSQEDRSLEETVGVCEFALPERPIDILRAGVILDKDTNESVLEQYMGFMRSVLVYKDGALIDLLDVNIVKQTIIVPAEGHSMMQQSGQEVCDAEYEWAEKHSLEWQPTKRYTIALCLD